MKVGRNDPCPCGSGKKYKKCCLSKDTMIVNDLKNFRLEEVKDPKEIERIRKEVEIKQGPEPHINLVPSIIWKGYISLRNSRRLGIKKVANFLLT